jgi:hypothetical protein
MERVHMTSIDEALAEELIDAALALEGGATALCERMGGVTEPEARARVKGLLGAVRDALELQRERTAVIVREIVGGYTRAQASKLLACVLERHRMLCELERIGDDEAERLVADLTIVNELRPLVGACNQRLRELRALG